ncbi:MAG: RdgB/HAM1 family non-canonical purine NTP pyrophosphatase [Chitinophagaceae bacterium]|nr:MAG: RdgB/HAM1 family non-canonical purine NTP pyrophosphatase [Chitinophagaceae bacterium]
MTSIVFATNNPNKVSEIQAAVGDSIRIITLEAAGINVDIPEPHPTLEQNAMEKSRTIKGLSGFDCFSEDTGLEVDALNGEPGVLSARYAGDEKSPEKNIDKLLYKLSTTENRKARFRTVISLIWEGSEHLFEGICEGEIVFERRGRNGFGYDAVFMPSGTKRTFAEMDMTEKNVISHRRKAADKLVGFFNNQLL